ncbi:Palmitoyltransferase ZDHHC16 [Halotydeus destructor]|nr:Palmitoyltransferase ZDHHC16 [Halotydeus destructor]
MRLSVVSLCYNEHLDSGYFADVAMEPMFWFVDHFTEALGPVFVGAVILSLTIFVSVAYSIGLPWWWDRSPAVTSVALIIGNWILVNVIFHYYMALKTSPGHPPENTLLPEVVSICKKCIAPKPPRAHHCSVCNKCILKMDHHCPWLNNCIGHFNHRYFFMFCFYTWLGTIFVFVFGVWIAYDHWLGTESFDREAAQVLAAKSNETLAWTWISVKHGLCLFELLSAACVFLAIGGLMMWHFWLITRGETCVESFINDKEKKKQRELGVPFTSTYDNGAYENWRIFLGFRSGHGWRQVIFPSTHLPTGTGLTWDIHRKRPQHSS